MPQELTVLITRPKEQGLSLQAALADVGISSKCQPLFHYQLATNQDDIQQQVLDFQPHVIIFVSVAAVNFSHQAKPLSSWINTNHLVIAVGEATQNALAKQNIPSICPKTHTSEGLLALQELNKEQLKTSNNPSNILIVRGDGGRELLAEELTSRGANVQYLEAYERIWTTLTSDQQNIWQHKKVNTVVITSNALLKRVVDLINIDDKYWQNTCLWLVASDRIESAAKSLGFNHVINAHGASNHSIVTSLLKMESKND